MGKSSKATFAQRVDDVKRLLVAGAESSDIRQFAAARGWDVSDRQLQRYTKVAYRQMAKAACRDRRQLLGLHLTKRRALYARCVKANDNRTALQILGDEAKLLALYPSAAAGSTTPNANDAYPRLGESPLSLRERVSRYLKARLSDDQTELRIVEHLSPQMVYELSDTYFPLMLLNTLAMYHTIAQLELAVLFHDASSHLAEETDDDMQERLWWIMKVIAYRVKIEAAAWARFTAAIGADGQALLKANNPGGLLPAQSEQICMLAPATEELPELVARLKWTVDHLPTVESSTRHWKKLYAGVLHE